MQLSIFRLKWRENFVKSKAQEFWKSMFSVLQWEAFATKNQVLSTTFFWLWAASLENLKSQF